MERGKVGHASVSGCYGDGYDYGYGCGNGSGGKVVYRPRPGTRTCALNTTTATNTWSP